MMHGIIIHSEHKIMFMFECTFTGHKLSWDNFFQHDWFMHSCSVSIAALKQKLSG